MIYFVYMLRCFPNHEKMWITEILEEKIKLEFLTAMMKPTMKIGT